MIIRHDVPEIPVHTVNPEQSEKGPFGLRKYRDSPVQKAEPDFSLSDFFQPDVKQKASSHKAHGKAMRKPGENVHVEDGNVPQRKVQQHSGFFEDGFHRDKSVDLLVVGELVYHPVEDDVEPNHDAKLRPAAHVTFVVELI